MFLYSSKYKVLFKAISVVLVCLFIVSDISFAQSSDFFSSKSSTLAPNFRVNDPIFRRDYLVRAVSHPAINAYIKQQVKREQELFGNKWDSPEESSRVKEFDVDDASVIGRIKNRVPGLKVKFIKLAGIYAFSRRLGPGQFGHVGLSGKNKPDDPDKFDYGMPVAYLDSAYCEKAKRAIYRHERDEEVLWQNLFVNVLGITDREKQRTWIKEHFGASDDRINVDVLHEFDLPDELVGKNAFEIGLIFCSMSYPIEEVFKLANVREEENDTLIDLHVIDRLVEEYRGSEARDLNISAKAPATSDTTIFFDVGNVLFPFNYHKLSKKLAGHFPLLEPVIYNIICGPQYMDKLMIPLETGEIDLEEYFSRLRKLVPEIDMEFEAFEEAYCDVFTRNEEAIGALKRLKNKGHRVFLLSNTCEVHRKYWEREYPDVMSIVDGVVTSYETKVMKPERRMFERALDLAGVNPGDKTIFIDDVEENAKAFLEVGSASIHYVPGLDIEEKVEEIAQGWSDDLEDRILGLSGELIVDSRGQRYALKVSRQNKSYPLNVEIIKNTEPSIPVGYIELEAKVNPAILTLGSVNIDEDHQGNGVFPAVLSCISAVMPVGSKLCIEALEEEETLRALNDGENWKSTRMGQILYRCGWNLEVMSIFERHTSETAVLFSNIERWKEFYSPGRFRFILDNNIESIIGGTGTTDKGATVYVELSKSSRTIAKPSSRKKSAPVPNAASTDMTEGPALYINPDTREIRELEPGEHEALHIALRKLINFKSPASLEFDKKGVRLLTEPETQGLAGRLRRDHDDATSPQLSNYIMQDRALYNALPEGYKHISRGLICHAGTWRDDPNKEQSHANIFMSRSVYQALIHYGNESELELWRRHELDGHLSHREATIRLKSGDGVIIRSIYEKAERIRGARRLAVLASNRHMYGAGKGRHEQRSAKRRTKKEWQSDREMLRKILDAEPCTVEDLSILTGNTVKTVWNDISNTDLGTHPNFIREHRNRTDEEMKRDRQKIREAIRTGARTPTELARVTGIPIHRVSYDINHDFGLRKLRENGPGVAQPAADAAYSRDEGRGMRDEPGTENGGAASAPSAPQPAAEIKSHRGGGIEQAAAQERRGMPEQNIIDFVKSNFSGVIKSGRALNILDVGTGKNPEFCLKMKSLCERNDVAVNLFGIQPNTVPSERLDSEAIASASKSGIILEETGLDEFVPEKSAIAGNNKFDLIFINAPNFYVSEDMLRNVESSLATGGKLIITKLQKDDKPRQRIQIISIIKACFNVNVEEVKLSDLPASASFPNLGISVVVTFNNDQQTVPEARPAAEADKLGVGSSELGITESSQLTTQNSQLSAPDAASTETEYGPALFLFPQIGKITELEDYQHKPLNETLAKMIDFDAQPSRGYSSGVRKITTDEENSFIGDELIGPLRTRGLPISLYLMDDVNDEEILFKKLPSDHKYIAKGLITHAGTYRENLPDGKKGPPRRLNLFMYRSVYEELLANPEALAIWRRHEIEGHLGVERKVIGLSDDEKEIIKKMVETIRGKPHSGLKIEYSKEAPAPAAAQPAADLARSEREIPPPGIDGNVPSGVMDMDARIDVMRDLLKSLPEGVTNFPSLLYYVRRYRQSLIEPSRVMGTQIWRLVHIIETLKASDFESPAAKAIIAQAKQMRTQPIDANFEGLDKDKQLKSLKGVREGRILWHELYGFIHVISARVKSGTMTFYPQGKKYAYDSNRISLKQGLIWSVKRVPESAQAARAPAAAGNALPIAEQQSIQSDIDNAHHLRENVLPEREKKDGGKYYTVRYNGLNLSTNGGIEKDATAEGLLSAYVRYLFENSQSYAGRISIDPNGDKNNLITVECYKDASRTELVGKSHVNIKEALGRDKAARIIGMLNMALAASHIPLGKTAKAINEEYPILKSFIECQFKELAGNDATVPEETWSNTADGINIVLPHAQQIPVNVTIGDYYRYAIKQVENNA